MKLMKIKFKHQTQYIDQIQLWSNLTKTFNIRPQIHKRTPNSETITLLHELLYSSTNGTNEIQL